AMSDRIKYQKILTFVFFPFAVFGLIYVLIRRKSSDVKNAVLSFMKRNGEGLDSMTGNDEYRYNLLEKLKFTLNK
ncbi:MAG: hypothetical protein UT06_C0058G0010, partial [Candidatus Woesebacteria bacterium GW2011_GWA1_38_8]